MSHLDIEQIAAMALNSHDKLQPETKFPCIALPNNYALHSLEQHQANRNLFRGEFTTSRIKDFVLYCNEMDIEAVNYCFVNPDGMSASMIFDLGTPETPEHCKHKALLNLKKTTAFESGVMTAINYEFSQQALFNYLQDWKNYLTVIDANDKELPTTTACQRVLNIDIKRSLESNHQVSDFSSSVSDLAKIEAQSKEGQPLPKGILFTCKPYDSLREYSFFLRLSLKQGHKDKPFLSLRCEGLDDLQNQMRDEFAETLVQSFPDKVLLGKFKAD